MILQYFKNRENKEKNIAFHQYKKIIYSSKKILNNSILNLEKDFNISFEIITIFLILLIQNNLKSLLFSL